jgi:hypothetical protein
MTIRKSAYALLLYRCPRCSSNLGEVFLRADDDESAAASASVSASTPMQPLQFEDLRDVRLLRHAVRFPSSSITNITVEQVR